MEKQYTKKQQKILEEITNFCEQDCSEREQCIEEDCVLWRIEQLIISKEKRHEK